MIKIYSLPRALLGTVLLLILSYGQSYGQSAFFSELFGRAMRIDDALPNNQSQKMSLLWMSYLADAEQPAALSELANTALSEGENGRALALLSHAFETSGRDYHTGLLLLSLAGYESDWDKVEEVKDDLLAQRPGDPSVLYGLMQVYQMGGKDSLAIDVVRSLLESDRNNPQYIFRLAGMLTESERYAEAEDLLRKYLEDHPGDMIGTRMLVTFLMDREKMEEASKLAEDFYKRHPGDPSVLQLVVGSGAGIGDYARIAGLIQEYAYTQDAVPEITLHLIGTAQQAAKDREAFEEAFLPLRQKLKADFPDEEGYQVLVLQHFVANGDTTGLKTEAKELVSRSSKARPAYDILLQEYVKNNDNDAVRHLVEKGLKAYPEDPTFLLYDIIGDLIEKPEGGDEVMKKIDHALSVIPEDKYERTEISVAKADLLEAAGKWEEARPLYESAAEKGHIGASNNLAYFLSERGTKEDLAYAEKLAAKVVEAEPDNATYLDTYAWVLYKREAYTLAKLYMEKALDKAAPADSTYLEHYARILTALGEYDAAIRAWEKAVKAGFDPDPAKKEIEALNEKKAEK